MPDWIGILLCVVLWLPVHAGLWWCEKRRAKMAWRLLQAYGAIAMGCGLWLGLTLFRGHFAVFGGPWQWILAAVPPVGLLMLEGIVLPGRKRSGITWQEAIGQLVHFVVVVGLFEEVWFRGIWFACFRYSFLGSVVLGSVVFGFVHYSPFREGRQLDSVIGSALAGLTFAAARYNGAGVLLLGVGHGLCDFVFHYVTVDKRTRFGAVGTVAVYAGGCLLIAAVAFLWSQ